MAYLRTRVIASFGTLCAGALVLVACGGKNLNLGTNTTQSQQVAPSLVSGTVPPCGDGAAQSTQTAHGRIVPPSGRLRQSLLGEGRVWSFIVQLRSCA